MIRSVPKQQFAQLKNPLETLDEYYKIVKRALVQYEFIPHIKKLLNDDEFVSYIVHDLIVADANWNPKRNLSKFGYRKQCIKWSLLTQVKRWRAAKAKSVQELTNSIFTISGSSNRRKSADDESPYIDPKSPGQIDLEFQEELEWVYNNSNLSPIAKMCLKLRNYYGFTNLEIGEFLGITGSAVSTMLTKARANLMLGSA